MEITQEQVTALEEWIENRKAVYIQKGFALAGQAGIEAFTDYKSEASIPVEDAGKTLDELKRELELAVEFHKEAKTLLFAGRQGG